MRAVGLKILKNKLSEYVRLVTGGETVLITDRDGVVAELVAPPTGRGHPLAVASSRLTEYEVWTRVHARTLGSSHGESVRLLLGRFGWLEVTPTVLARALAARRPNAGCPSSRLNRVSPRPRSGRDAGNLRRSD